MRKKDRNPCEITLTQNTTMDDSAQLSSDDKLPKTYQMFYAKMYIKKKKGVKNKYYNNLLIEAIKSWQSLNDNEKQKFIAKHKENQIKYKNKFATYLKYAEPYMKKKKIKRQPENCGIETNNTSKLEETLLQYEVHGTIHHDSIADISDRSHSHTTTDLETDTQNEFTSEQQQSLPEPTPPAVTTAKELFEMVQTTEENNYSSWILLPHTEQKRYQNAVLTLKKEYIRKYKAYLESLTSNDLFDHYNRVL